MVKRGILGVTALLVLGTLAYVAWDRMELHRLNQAITAIGSRGEPGSLEFWTTRRRTDEQRQAASLYAQAADLAYTDALEDNHRAGRLDVDQPAGRELSLAEIDATYPLDAPALKTLDRATPLSFNGFDEPDLYRSAQPLGALVSLACLRSDLLAVHGRTEEAATALTAAIGLQRTMVSSFVRAGAALRILGSTRILVRHGKLSDQSLGALQQAMQTWPDEDSSVPSLFLDRVLYLERADDFRPRAATLLDPAWLSRVRDDIDAYAESLDFARQPWPAKWQAWDRRDAAVRQLQRHFAGPSLLSRWLGIDYVNRDLNLPGLMTILSAANELAARRLIAGILAIERYRREHGGAPPPALARLVPAYLPSMPDDPFGGGPLVYKPSADGGYLLYSVDANRKDDGGLLYGFGTGEARRVGQQSPRDLGIRVPATPMSSSGPHGS